MLFDLVLPFVGVVIGGLIAVCGYLGSVCAGVDEGGVRNGSWVLVLKKWKDSDLFRTVSTFGASTHDRRWNMDEIQR